MHLRANQYERACKNITETQSAAQILHWIRKAKETDEWKKGEIQRVLATINEKKIALEPETKQAVMALYSQLNLPIEAMQYMDNRPDAKTLDTVVRGLLRNQHKELALQVLENNMTTEMNLDERLSELQEQVLSWNNKHEAAKEVQTRIRIGKQNSSSSAMSVSTLNNRLRLYIEKNQIDRIRETWRFLRAASGESNIAKLDLETYVMLIHLFVRAGMCGEANQIYDIIHESPQRLPATFYKRLWSGLAANHRYDLIVSQYDLLRRSISPTDMAELIPPNLEIIYTAFRERRNIKAANEVLKMFGSGSSAINKDPYAQHVAGRL